jgi:hypothetical protein
MSGPFTLASKINLQIDSGAVLKAVSMANYPNNTAPANFIEISAKTDVEISGSGTIDGNGADWWAAYNANNSIKRPRLIDGKSSGGVSNDRIWIRNVTLQNSPMFHIALSGSNDVTIDSVTVRVIPVNPNGNPDDGNQPNTDAMDIGGNHYLVENCTIDVGDDDVVAKPGSTASSDMTITNCTILHGHGISVGGQTNLGLNGMTVTNCTFNGTTDGLRLKADRTEGGLVQNLSYSNITMTNVQYPILFYSYYNTGLPSDASADTTTTPSSTEPYWQNITITNLTSTTVSTDSNYGSSYCGVIWGLPEAPILNVSMTGVHLSAKYGFEINHARNVSFDSSSTLSAASTGRLISTRSSVSYDGTKPYDATVVKLGWTDSDIGTFTPPTTTVYDPDLSPEVLSLIAGGTGLGSTADQFNFEYQSITGNALVSAQVAALQTNNASAQAGVMLRDGTATNAAFVAVIEKPNKQVAMLYRSSAGVGVLTSAFVGDTTNAKYVKLTRVGDVFSAFYSTDGHTWTAVAAPVTISMPSALLAGICDSSASATSTTSAAFMGATVINDNTPPSLTADGYLYSTSLNKLGFTFSEDVSASLSASSLNVVTSPGGSPINVTGISYDSGTNTATFTLATPLTDGNYIATLSGSTTMDAVGNPLAGGSAQLPFFVLPGDVNRDGVVNALDFNALATNFGTSGGFAQGDLDFNGTINTNDFVVLAANFGSHATVSGAVSLASPPNLFSADQIHASVLPGDLV